MAKAKQLPSGSWRVRVYDSETKKYLSFTSQLEGKAGKNEAELMAREYQLGRKKKKEQGLTVGEAIDEYISLKENILSPTTATGYKKYKKTILAELCDEYDTKYDTKLKIKNKGRDETIITSFALYT